ncbi:MAG: hypothetical protein K2X61_05090 [Caulobacteraceae bacterium]|jgi:hypothetical protein|nr:hypothetical protein [Caulobacteraceae bacterium]
MTPDDEPARPVAMTGAESRSVQHWREVFAPVLAPVPLIRASLVPRVSRNLP